MRWGLCAGWCAVLVFLRTFCAEVRTHPPDAMRLRNVLSATPCFFAIWRFDKAPARKSASIACQSVSVFLGIPYHPAQQKCALQNAGTKNFSRVPLARFRCLGSIILLPLPLPDERMALQPCMTRTHNTEKMAENRRFSVFNGVSCCPRPCGLGGMAGSAEQLDVVLVQRCAAVLQLLNVIPKEPRAGAAALFTAMRPLALDGCHQGTPLRACIKAVSAFGWLFGYAGVQNAYKRPHARQNGFLAAAHVVATSSLDRSNVTSSHLASGDGRRCNRT